MRLPGTASLTWAAGLVVLGLVLFLLQPRWPAFEQWQSDRDVKRVTGYVLLLVMACMWLPVGLRRRFGTPAQLELIKVSHQWLGALVLVMLLAHANLARSGYLGLLSWALLALSMLGVALSWMQARHRARGRRWVIASHIALGFLASAFSFIHLYFVYAYAG